MSKEDIKHALYYVSYTETQRWSGEKTAPLCLSWGFSSKDVLTRVAKRIPGIDKMNNGRLNVYLAAPVYRTNSDQDILYYNSEGTPATGVPSPGLLVLDLDPLELLGVLGDAALAGDETETSSP